jgi:hypothetical protein
MIATTDCEDYQKAKKMQSKSTDCEVAVKMRKRSEKATEK